MVWHPVDLIKESVDHIVLYFQLTKLCLIGRLIPNGDMLAHKACYFLMQKIYNRSIYPWSTCLTLLTCLLRWMMFWSVRLGANVLRLRVSKQVIYLIDLHYNMAWSLLRQSISKTMSIMFWLHTRLMIFGCTKLSNRVSYWFNIYICNFYTLIVINFKSLIY